MTKNETKPQDAAKVLELKRKACARGGRKAWRNLSSEEASRRARLNRLSGDMKEVNRIESLKAKVILLMPTTSNNSLHAQFSIGTRTLLKWRKETGLPRFCQKCRCTSLKKNGKYQVTIKGKYIGLFTTQKEADAKVAELTNKTK